MRGGRLLAFLLLAACLTLAPAAWALDPGERLADPALEARARALSTELRCLVCQNQSIDDSDADLARDLRVLVRERIQAGDSDEEVREFLVARYGEFVLLRPRLGAATLLLWLTPALAVLLGVGLLVAQRRGRAAAAERLTPEEERRLADLLEREG